MNIKEAFNFRIPPLVMIALVVFTSCKDSKNKQKDAFGTTMNITGSVAGFSQGAIKLTELLEAEASPEDILAEAKIQNGTFSFENIKVDTARVMQLSFGDSIHTLFFLEEGALQIEIFPKDTVFTEFRHGTEVGSLAMGTVNNEAFNQYRALRKKLETAPKYLMLRHHDKNLFSIEPDYDLLNEVYDTKEAILVERDSLVFELKRKTIREHKDKILAPYLLVHEDFGIGDDFDGVEVIQFFNDLDTQLKGNPYYDRIAEFVEASKNTVKGAIAPDFMLKNENGKAIALSDLDHEYVLVDFWAYWCVPCIASFPHLEEVREKYKDKGFEILGVSADPNHEKWIGALEKYQPSWIQVVDSDDKMVSQDYNITELPTSFLLDKNGKIIAKNPEGDALDDLLEELFNQ